MKNENETVLKTNEGRVECTSSPDGEHGYNTSKYARDDQGFYLKCVHCGQEHFFEGYSLEDYFPDEDDF